MGTTSVKADFQCKIMSKELFKFQRLGI